MNFITRVKNKINKKMIDDLEYKYSIKFPKALKKYYLKYGDCSIKYCTFEIDGFSFGVHEMVPLKADSKLSFDEVIYCDRSEEWIPKNFYPLAWDGGANFYYWDSTNGYVYIVYNDDVDYPYEICKSVKEFFKLLEKSKKGL